MHFEGNSAVHRTLRRLATRLDELGVDYAIAGGIALSFHGFCRVNELINRLVTVLVLFRLQKKCALCFVEMAGCRVGTNRRGLILVL